MLVKMIFQGLRLKEKVLENNACSKLKQLNVRKIQLAAYQRQNTETRITNDLFYIPRSLTPRYFYLAYLISDKLTATKNAGKSCVSGSNSGTSG